MNNSSSTRPGASRGKWLTVLLFLAMLLVAVALRFYGLDAQSFWNDEGTSVALGQRDLVTIARDASHDIHPPLYYWLLSGWMRLTGSSELTVRCLSAMLGVVLVVLTYALGRLLIGRWAGLVAMLLAAVNPFQVYYSQEARMYMLAAVLAAAAVLTLVRFVQKESWPALALMALLETAGIYTHYSFIFVILILNLAYVLWLLPTRSRERRSRRLGTWVFSQALVMLVYLPWLPTAVRQVTTWPGPTQTSALLPAVANTWRWLVFGPTVETGQVAIPLLLVGIVFLLGIVALVAGWTGRSELRNGWIATLLVLWSGLPVLLMFALDLYREAYLKFLLVATPAVSLLLASGLVATPPIAGHKARQDARDRFHVSRFTLYALRLLQTSSALAILVASGLALQNYYSNPLYARDDYRSIAAYVAAVGQPGDAILLNAPGQQEVFGYYYDGDVPVYPLPESRPLDPDATESALTELTESGGRVFAVLWATDESDPQRFVEGWLDTHAYKALDSWYGNVRLIVYAAPGLIPSAPDHTLGVPLRSDETGDEIVLRGYSLLNDRLAAGDIAQFTLFWQANQTLTQRYKVFLHVLDGDNQIVGQRDAEPGGGRQLTTLWGTGEVIVDNQGVPIHPATPPGEYRVEVGMYNPETGQRLNTPDGGTQIWLKPLTVDRPSAAVPIVALGMDQAAGAGFGELTLLGYDAHKLGFAHQPEVPLQPGDALHVNLYWRAETQPSGDWQVLLALLDADELERARITAEPVRGYSTSRWEAGDVWRGQFNLSVPADAPAEQYRLSIQPLAPDGMAPGVYLSRPLRVGP